MNPITVKYIAKINGKRAINGELYGVAIKGDGEIVVPHIDAYDTLADLAETLKESNKDMESVSGMQITITFDPPVQKDL